MLRKKDTLINHTIGMASGGASISAALSLRLPFTSTALAGATAAVGVRCRSNCLARVDGGDRDGVGDEGRPGFRPPPSDR
jgi:hypothetical protein